MLAEDFAAVTKLEGIVKSLRESTDAAWKEEQALEKDRKNRRFFGWGPLKKEVCEKIGNSQYGRDCTYEMIGDYEKELAELQTRIGQVQAIETAERHTAEIVDGFSGSGTSVVINVRRPLRLKTPGNAGA